MSGEMSDILFLIFTIIPHIITADCTIQSDILTDDVSIYREVHTNIIVYGGYLQM